MRHLLSTQDVHTYLDQAEEAKQQGRHRDAIRLCEKAYALDLDCTDALEELADNYISLEQYGKAKKAIEHALSLKPHSPNSNFLMGFILVKATQWQEAIRFLNTADTLLPNHPEVLRNLGWAHYNSRQKKRGLLLLERALNLAPEDTYIMCDLGICYLNEKDFKRAIELFRRALTLEPENSKFAECMKTAEYFRKEFDQLRT